MAPDADRLLLAGLLEILAGAEAWRRLECTSAGNHEDLRSGGPPDRLEPIFDLDVPPSGAWNLQRVHVPCGGTRIYYLHLEGKREWTAAEIESALAAAPGCLVVRAADGFGNTGLIGEYFRDRGRKLGVHHEIVVWGDSITTQGTHVYLMAEADPRGAQRMSAAQAPGKEIS